MQNKRIYIPNLSVFTTEKCNLKCQHCMRGDCTNKDISDEVIQRTLDSVDIIGTLHICGGEPTLAIDRLEKLINDIIDSKKSVYYFSLTINGTNYSEELVCLCRELYDYIVLFGKPDKKMIDISFDYFHQQELIRLGLWEQFLDNIKKYEESKSLGYIRELDIKKTKLFRCGRAASLDESLTVPLRPMSYYICDNSRITGIGPIVSVNVDGIVTECDASFDEQRTIYNYGNVLDESIREICLKNGAKEVSPRKWNKCIKKELKRYSEYNR